jgi:hypothetical protein
MQRFAERFISGLKGLKYNRIEVSGVSYQQN